MGMLWTTRVLSHFIGYVDTDMSSHMGPLTPDQGAQSTIFCATIPEEQAGTMRGVFVWHDNTIVEFDKSSCPPT